MFDKVKKIINADLKDFSTFKIGGKGNVIFPKNIAELKRVIKECEQNKLEYFVLGNGSNVLFPDYDLKTILISLKKFNKIKKDDETLFVEAGVNMFTLNKFCVEQELQGLEWSYGIPASFGGLLHMNGGAYENSIGNFVESVKILKNGKTLCLDSEALHFSYRSSNIDGIIIGATIKLEKGKKEKIKERQNYYLECRKNIQPLNYPSAGSVFKRSEKIIPAKIIDEFNLKGTRIGDAEISKKHAGFIVNLDNAKAIDVIALIEYIKQKCKMNFEEEIVILK